MKRRLIDEFEYHQAVKHTHHSGEVYQVIDLVENFVSEQLELWGLEGWGFRWDHARCRLGSCRYDRKQITLSKYFVSCNPNHGDQIRDTILHEIAHALAWIHCGEKGHGRRWKEWCLRVGASPQAVARGEKIVSLPPKYLLRDKNTGEVYGRYYRKPRFARWLKRMEIRGKPNTRGNLELVLFQEIE